MTGLAKVIFLVLLMQPVPAGVPKAQHEAWLRHVAPAIVHATHDPELLAYVVTVGTFESHMAERIQAGRCNKHKRECDGGQAHSMWQLHARALPPGVRPADVVGADDAHLQAAAAAATRRIVQARAMCGGAHPARVFAGYAQSCAWKPDQAAKRARTFQRVLAQIRLMQAQAASTAPPDD